MKHTHAMYATPKKGNLKKVKGGKLCWCQGKCLGELAKNICNKLAKSFEFDFFFLCCKVGQVPYTPYL